MDPGLEINNGLSMSEDRDFGSFRIGIGKIGGGDGGPLFHTKATLKVPPWMDAVSGRPRHLPLPGMVLLSEALAYPIESAISAHVNSLNYMEWLGETCQC